MGVYPVVLLPWRMVKTWECLMCGVCCEKFVVPLTQEEVIRLTMKYGPFVVYKGSRRPTLMRINGRCVFLKNGKCSIQEDKPKACKLWPFHVYDKPLRIEDRNLADYEFLGETYYIYLDSDCYGINQGSTPVESILPEVMSIKLGLLKDQILTTGRQKIRVLP